MEKRRQEVHICTSAFYLFILNVEIQNNKILYVKARLQNSPGPGQSSPGWCREVLRVQGSPGGSGSTPGPAGKPESLLSASYQPVCPLVSERTEDTESPCLTVSYAPSLLFKGGRGIDLCSVCSACPHSHSQVKNKQVKEQSSASLSLALCSDLTADHLNIGLQSFGNINKSIHLMIGETNE